MGEIWVTRGGGGEGDALLSGDLLISSSWLEKVSASRRSLLPLPVLSGYLAASGCVCACLGCRSPL